MPACGCARHYHVLEKATMSNQRFILIPTRTVGSYAHDADGNPWATFSLTNGVVACAACGVPISCGWARGKVGEETYVCSEHVTLQRESEQHHA